MNSSGLFRVLSKPTQTKSQIKLDYVYFSTTFPPACVAPDLAGVELHGVKLVIFLEILPNARINSLSA